MVDLLFYIDEGILMLKKPPNKFIAPIVIAGITAGFFISAYKFVFAKPKKKDELIHWNNQVNQPQPEKDND